jgi:hypothetical protein
MAVEHVPFEFQLVLKKNPRTTEIVDFDKLIANAIYRYKSRVVTPYDLEFVAKELGDHLGTIVSRNGSNIVLKGKFVEQLLRPLTLGILNKIN